MNSPEMDVACKGYGSEVVVVGCVTAAKRKFARGRIMESGLKIK